MISLVLISHSSTLAQGVAELAQQMAPGVQIVPAGGTAEGEIGTSFELILEALALADSPDGTLVLMDLGSAVMTAETALEFIEEAQRARVRLSNAPLVEGALAAAALAATGASLSAVADAADETRTQPKLSEAQDAAPPLPAAAATHERAMRLVNPAGLHARPAAQIVGLAGRWQAELRLRQAARPGPSASARSLVALLGLGGRQGTELVASASGPEAQQALEALAELVASGFGEMEEPPAVMPAPPAPPPPTGIVEGEGVRGVPAAPGKAIGPAFWLKEATPSIPDTPAEDPEQEAERLQAALATARQALRSLEQQSARSAGASEAAIFEAQRFLLDDPLLLERASARIEQRDTAAAAWDAATRAEAEGLRAIGDPLIAGRAADLLDVGRRVVRLLVDAGEPPTVPPGAIVLAEEIDPSQVALLKQAGAGGLATEGGGTTSHAAILARAFELPAVMGLGPALRSIESGQMLLVDGANGLLLPNPSDAQVATFHAQLQAEQAEATRARAAAQAPALTRDGHRVVIAANVASVTEAEAAVARGAEGVGLLRTEFLYMGRATLPSEEEQVAALRAIFAPFGERPIIVRTLDVGGDKPLPALALDPIIHSFLGVRGLRLSLQRPALFEQQLRAILRAAEGHRVSLMFPMVSTVEEVRAARAHLASVQQALDAAGTARGSLEEVGIMVEVPAAALAADRLAAEVDFFSVGSNDLTQYTMAAERTNREVANLYQPNHPALLRLLAQLVEQAHAHHRWVGVCGEMAGDPALTPLLLGLGMDELSMTPASIPAVKATIREWSLEEARDHLARAL